VLCCQNDAYSTINPSKAIGMRSENIATAHLRLTFALFSADPIAFPKHPADWLLRHISIVSGPKEKVEASKASIHQRSASKLSKTMGNQQSTCISHASFLLLLHDWLRNSTDRRFVQGIDGSYCFVAGDTPVMNGRCCRGWLKENSLSTPPLRPCPSRQICGARRSNTSQTFHRCQTTFRCGRSAIWGGSGHGRPAKPSIEGGGGRFSTFVATLEVRLKLRTDLRPNPCSGS
jgi:hypothetical protein